MKNTRAVKSPKTSKPFYQQWWFWVILVIIIAICGGALSKNDEATSPSSTPSISHPDDNTTLPTSDTPNTPSTPSIGVAVPAGKVEIIVKSVDRRYVASYAKPADNMEYIKVNLSIKNTSDEIQGYNALHFKIEDGNGSIESYTNAAMAQADDALNHGDLAAHGSKNGSIVFEVPAGDTNLKLHIYDNGFSSKILNTIDLSH